jgi:hypothetical protein
LQTIVRILVIAGFAALPTLARSQEVTATHLDGTAVSGQLHGWSGNDIVLVRADGEVRLQTDHLVSLRWPSPGPSVTGREANGGLVELTDGTVLPMKEFAANEATATIEISAPPPAKGQTMTLPLRQVVVVRSGRFEPQIEQQWEEIRSQDAASDLLVLFSPDRKNLDQAEGVLGPVTSAKIEFELDGDTRRVDRGRLAGWIYFRKRASPESDPLCIVHGRTGLRACAKNVRLKDETLEITTTGGAKLAWPLADVDFADFSAGKIIYLSDMKPALARWTPLIGFASAAESAADYGQVRADQSAFGGPLSLYLEGIGGSAREAKSFGKGLAIRSRTELVYRLPAGFKQFVALAGIEPATHATGDVQLSIYGDDRSLVNADIAGDERPREIKLDVTGVKRLKIVVDYGQNLDTGDWLNLCEARLIK